MSSPDSETRSSRATSIPFSSGHAGDSSVDGSPNTATSRSANLVQKEAADDNAFTATSASKSRSRNAKTELESLVDIESEEEEEEDVDIPIRRPRGKLAARLLGQDIGRVTNSKSESDASDHETGRTKLRKESAHLPSDKTSSEDEEDSPVKTSTRRKLLKRKALSPSPRNSQTPITQSRASSPGLFVSSGANSPVQSKSMISAVDDSDSDVPTQPVHNARFLELVAKKKAERKAREEENRRKDAEKIRRFETLSNQSRKAGRAGSDSDEDGETGRRLTQQARPTRKASKKAVEEMNRETQRIVRNMQLAHQAKTRKKFNLQDLVSKLNPVKESIGIGSPLQQVVGTNTDSVTASSDVEGPHEHDTPPTSPPSHDEHTPKDVPMTLDAPTAVANYDADNELPDLVEILSQPKRLDKGKGRASDSLHIPVNPLVAQTAKPVIAQKVRVPLPKQFSSNMVDLDSDSDLEITNSKSRFPVFDRLPKEQHKHSRAMITQRVLANLTSPGKQGSKGRGISINPSGLQASLQRLARQQALRDRDERLAELKAQGKVFQTEEEIEREQLQMDSMLEKAREMDAKLAKKEKEDAKKNGKAIDGLDSDDDDDDEDWEGSGKDEAGDEDAEDQVEEELELSGSEDEEAAIEVEDEASDQDDADEEGEGEDAGAADLLDREAGEDNESEEEDLDEADGEASDEGSVPAPRKQRANKRSRQVILEDDEDSDHGSQQKVAEPSQPILDDGMAAFGFDMDNTTSLGLTQMFAGTMANLQSQSQLNEVVEQDTQEDSLVFFRSLPLTQPIFDASLPDASPDLLIPNSQVIEDSQSGPNVGQHGVAGQMSDTQFSEAPEPTQDAGFELSRFPAGLVAPASTIDTIIMPVPESPVLKRKGKLHRRAAAVTALSDVDEDLAADSDGANEVEQSASAFDVLRKAAKKSVQAQDFDRKTSEAKRMFEEQAEESEDEYAGLGGQSDDESGGELDEEVAKMIDEGEVNVDERKIAAYYAEKSRADDEKAIDKLYKDVHNGGLRRKRGNDFDLSDAEDEEEERRRRRQLEYKKMRQALYADEKIGEIAQNPKKAAFLRALEDHDDDADNDYLLDGPGADFNIEIDASQSAQAVSVPDSQVERTADVASVNPLKRKHVPTDSQEKENRPPPHLRRTGVADEARKPQSLADIRESVSFLIDEPHSIPESQFSASESEGEEDTTRSVRASRPIIDRLSLSRSNSATEAASGAMAFHAPVTGSHPGFRVPSLIRRATSNLSTKGSNATSTTSSGAATPVESAQGVRRGGSGKSNIHYQAREAERRAALEKSDKRRREGIRKKAAKGRKGFSILGRLDSGFE